MSTSRQKPPEPDPSGQAPRAFRGGWRLALGALGTVGLLGALAASVEWSRVGAVFARLDARWVGLGFALYVGLQCVRAFRYRLLAPAASVRVLVGVHFVHALLLRVMPLRTGELGFAWLMRRQGAGFARSLVGVLLVRVLDLATVLVVFAAGLLLFGGMGGSYGSRPGFVIAFAAAALLLPLYLQHLVRLGHRTLDALLVLVRLDRIGRIGRARAALSDAVSWSGTLSRGLLWQLTGLTFVQWGVNFAIFFVMLRAMRLDASFAQTVLGGTGAVLGGLLPLAGVGNFGPLEAGWSLGFAAAGLDRDLAIASAFAFSVISFGYALLTGAVGAAVLPGPSEEADRENSSDPP